jgi:hypothetical protein
MSPILEAVFRHASNRLRCGARVKQDGVGWPSCVDATNGLTANEANACYPRREGTDTMIHAEMRPPLAAMDHADHPLDVRR